MSGFAPVKLSFGGAKLPSKKPIPTPAFGLPSKKAASSSVFGAAEDDEDVSQPPLASTSNLSKQQQRTNGQPKVSTATLSRAQKAKQAEEIALDASVYEYDAVYDSMKQGSTEAERNKKQDNSDRKPKYMVKLMETAELRKRDRERAEDNTAQREREREGDMYADKEQFVTSAFKAQQEERKRKDEEDKRREEEAKKKGGKPSFLKDMLDADDKVHAAAVAASLTAPITTAKPVSGPSFNIAPPPKEKTEAELAAEASARTGQRVEVNEDGEIVDKRQLMSGGLNIAKPRLGPSAPSGGFADKISDRRESERGTGEGAGIRHLTSADGLTERERERQRRERHSQMIERQMIEQQERRKREAEQDLEQKVQKVAKRTDADRKEELIRAAKERRAKKEEDDRRRREEEEAK